MVVEGRVPTDLLRGSYGPGEPREILTKLLDSARCNYVLMGATPEGMPRQLILSPRSDKPKHEPQSGQQVPAPARAAAPAFQDASASAQNDPPSTQASATAEDPMNAEPLGPGAIAHVPPNETDDASSEANAGPRMQQHLQKLQQLQKPQDAPE